MFLDVNAEGFPGEPHHQFCQSCKQVIRQGEPTEVVRFDGDRVDMVAAVKALGQRGASIVLAEGGPTLNGQLHDAGLIDELCLTLSPLLVGTAAARVIDGAGLNLQHLSLDRVLEEDGWLFLRYVRS